MTIEMGTLEMIGLRSIFDQEGSKIFKIRYQKKKELNDVHELKMLLHKKDETIRVANTKLIEVRKENFVLNMEVLRLDSALEEETVDKLKMMQEKCETILIAKDQEIKNVELFDKVANMDIEIRQLNISLDQEKLNLNEEKAKHQAFSDVIENQEKEIKLLNIALDQSKEEINEILNEKDEALLRTKRQNEGFLTEIINLKKQVKCSEIKHLNVALDKANQERLVAKEEKAEALLRNLNQTEQNQRLCAEIAYLRKEIIRLEMNLDERNKEKNKMMQEKALKDTELSIAKDREEKKIKEIVKTKIELECLNSALEQESRAKLKLIHEKDKAVLKTKELKQKNGEFSEKIESLNRQIKVLKESLELKDKENLKIVQEKNIALTEAKCRDDKSSSEIEKHVIEIQRLIQIEAENSRIIQKRDQELWMAKDMLGLAKQKEVKNVQEIVKHVIEVESLISENLKLTQEITFLNTNAHVNDLEVKRMSEEKEKEMIKWLYQKDEAISKANSELVQIKQNIARLKNSGCCADPEIQRNLQIILNSAVSRNKALFEANAADDKVASLNIEIEGLNGAFNMEVERLNGAFSQANKETLKVVQDMDRVISEAKSKEKRNVQEIVKYVIEIERLKEELKHEKYLNECLERTRFRHEDKMSVNLDNIKVNISEFMVMKDMIRNNIQVKFLNATIE